MEALTDLDLPTWAIVFWLICLSIYAVGRP